MTLWLVGLMGSGKTTVGRLVAHDLGRGFADTDEIIARQAGRPIPHVWSESGETAFRDLEASAVASLAGSETVVSTGGGAPCRSENRSAMSESGRVVWLKADVEVLAGRIESSGDRPLLETGTARADTLRALLAEREDVYRGLADLELATDALTPEEAARLIVEWWER